MPKKSDFKSEAEYNEYKAYNNEMMRQRRLKQRLLKVAELKARIYGPIPEVEFTTDSITLQKEQVHAVADDIGRKIRKRLLKRWKNDIDTQCIVDVITTVKYNINKVSYTISLTARGANVYKKWFDDELEEMTIDLNSGISTI